MNDKPTLGYWRFSDEGPDGWKYWEGPVFPPEWEREAWDRALRTKPTEGET